MRQNFEIGNVRKLATHVTTSTFNRFGDISYQLSAQLHNAIDSISSHMSYTISYPFLSYSHNLILQVYTYIYDCARVAVNDVNEIS